MTFRASESVLGFGEMSFADPSFEPFQKTTRARIGLPSPADFEMDPHTHWGGDIEEGDDEDVPVKETRHKNKTIHLDAVAPLPLTSTSHSVLSLSPDASHVPPRGRIQSGQSAGVTGVTGPSRSPSSRSTSTRQIRMMEEMHAGRQSSRRRPSTDTDTASTRKQGSSSSSPHYQRVSRRHLVQEQRSQSQDVMASSNRRLSEPSRRTIRLAALDVTGALAVQEVSPTSRPRSCDTHTVPLERAESTSSSTSSPTSHKASHHRRTSSRAASRRNLMVSPRPDVPEDPPAAHHRSGSASRRRPLDRSSSDGYAEIRRSVANASPRALVPPSKSDTRTYSTNNVDRHAVGRSASEGSHVPRESHHRDGDALLPHQVSPTKPNGQDPLSTHGSQSPSRSRRRVPRSQQSQPEEARPVEKTTHARSRSRSRRTEGSSRRERRTFSPSQGKDKPRARSKSRDASSRRHNQRTSGGRISKSKDNSDVLKMLESMLASKDSQDNDQIHHQTFDSPEDSPSRQCDSNPFPSDPFARDSQHLFDITSPTSSVSSPARRLMSPTRISTGGGGQPSQYILSNQASKEKKEESKLRRSNIMKSLKDLLQFDAENLKVEILEDGTKRLVVELSDLNTVMEDFTKHHRK